MTKIIFREKDFFEIKLRIIFDKPAGNRQKILKKSSFNQLKKNDLILFEGV
jgi:hypothetical protein